MSAARPSGARSPGSDAALTVAVLTFRRPDDLAELLPQLVEQCRRLPFADPATRILVVDNDAAGSARSTVETAARDASAGGASAGGASAGGASAGGASAGRGGPPVEIVYAVEPEPGIAAARNRALAESRDSRFLVFIDDDERPSQRWLEALVRLQRTTGAAGVVGPVESTFAREPDPWIVAGRFFVRRRLADGASLDVAATNNLLLDLDFVRGIGLEFDLALGVSGGEDTLFTRRVVAAGGLLVWAADALVTDVVPEARLTRRWVVQRAFSSGNGWSVTSLMLGGVEAGARARPGARLALRVPLRLPLRLRLTATGLTRVAGGAARLGVGTVARSLGQRARGVRTIARGAGMVTGAWGHRYAEYRR